MEKYVGMGLGKLNAKIRLIELKKQGYLGLKIVPYKSKNGKIYYNITYQTFKRRLK